MNIFKPLLISILVFSLFFSCQPNFDNVADNKIEIQIFQKEAVRFIPNTSHKRLQADKMELFI